MTKKSRKPIKKTKNSLLFFTVSGFMILMIILFISLIIIPKTINDIRKDRIISIYKSLNLSTQKYLLQSQSIFGDKRVYSWDSGRSASSMISVVRDTDVKTAFNELKAAVAKTDFKFYQEPYPGGADYIYIYKSPRNEYLRISASSKTRADEFFNKYHMGLSTSGIATDPNTGPTNIVIKVNLDDNNE